MRQLTHTEIKGNLQTDHEVRYRISRGAEVHIMRILRDMYSDPLRAVLREFMANGLDAHRMVGQTRPIEVSLPGHLDQALIFRDFGPGLADDDFEKYILGYGETGKEKMDDRGQIGGFGIGCKSFFAISSSAIFTSYHNGVETVWICQPDRTDCGVAKRVSSEPTDEPSGLKVEIPVSLVSCNGVKDKLKEVIRYFEQPVLVDGVLWEDIAQENGIEVLLDKESSLHGYPLRFRILKSSDKVGYAGNVTIVINGISYPINTKFFITQALEGDQDVLCNILNHKALVVNYVDGFLELAPNRESFIQNKTTGDVCSEMTKILMSILREHRQKIMKEASDGMDALIKVKNLYTIGIYPEIKDLFAPSYLESLHDCILEYGDGIKRSVYDICFLPQNVMESNNVLLCGKHKGLVSGKQCGTNHVIKAGDYSKDVKQRIWGFTNPRRDLISLVLNSETLYQKESSLYNYILENNNNNKKVEGGLLCSPKRLLPVSWMSGDESIIRKYVAGWYHKNSGDPFMLVSTHSKALALVGKYPHILKLGEDLREQGGKILKEISEERRIKRELELAKKDKQAIGQGRVEAESRPVIRTASKFLFRYKPGSYSTAASSEWEAGHVPETAFLYVVMDKFEPVSPTSRHKSVPFNRNKLLVHRELVDLFVDEHTYAPGVYGVKWSDKEELSTLEHAVEMSSLLEGLFKDVLDRTDLRIHNIRREALMVLVQILDQSISYNSYERSISDNYRIYYLRFLVDVFRRNKYGNYLKALRPSHPLRKALDWLSRAFEGTGGASSLNKECELLERMPKYINKASTENSVQEELNTLLENSWFGLLEKCPLLELYIREKAYSPLNNFDETDMNNILSYVENQGRK